MIQYHTNLDSITPETLQGSFFVGWPNPPSPSTHYRLLESSYRIVLAVDNEVNQVIGFIHAISDGVLSAYIPLLEVLPDYQSQGIGAELVRRMLEELNHLYMVDLLCDQPLQDYYLKSGMKPAYGMMIRNYGNQSGEMNSLI